jgi:hypothetical protein
VTQGNKILGESPRELRGEVDHFALVILGKRKLDRGQHGCNSGPQSGIDSVPALLKSNSA